MHKLLYIILFIVTGMLFGYLAFGSSNNFNALSPQEKHARIIEERNLAIAEAQTNGDYHCCIDPVCTMCYMEANEWNDYTPGVCHCDEKLAARESACPQCERALGDDGAPACEYTNPNFDINN